MLGLVVPGLLCLVAGTVCAFYAFLVGVSLIAFGALLLLLPALACRILKSLPDQCSPEDGNSKKESQRSIARDSRPTYGSRYAAAAYVNPAFEPKETMEEDVSAYSRVSAISCSLLQSPEKQQPQQDNRQRPLSPRQYQPENGAPRRYASTNSLAAELHSACRFQQHSGGKEPGHRASPDGHTGFRHIEFDHESARFGERPPRYSTVVRESPLI